MIAFMTSICSSNTFLCTYCTKAWKGSARCPRYVKNELKPCGSGYAIPSAAR